MDVWKKKNMTYLRKMLRTVWEKTFTKKIVAIISQSWMVTCHIMVTIYLTIHKWPWPSWSQKKVPTVIRGSGSPCCCHLHVSPWGNNAKVCNGLVLCMFTAQKNSNFNSKKWILHLLSSKCTWCLPVDCFCTVFKGGDMRAMAVWWAADFGHKSVESRFLRCFIVWMEGMGHCLVSRMWSLVLGT